MIFLVPIGAAAITSDVYGKKIPNPLIVAGLLLGAAYQWAMKGPPGWLVFLPGALIPLAAFGILHYFRMMGAGDIKLMMVLGGFLGANDILEAIWISFIIAGCMSAAILIKHRILRRRLNYFVQYIRTYWNTKKWEPYIRGDEAFASVHFAIPAVLGALFVAVRNAFGG